MEQQQQEMGKSIEEKRKMHEKKLEQCKKANDDILANKRIEFEKKQIAVLEKKHEFDQQK